MYIIFVLFYNKQTHQKVSTFRTKKIELIMDASMKNDTYNNLNGEKNENNYNNYNDNNNNAIIDDNNQSNENESFKRNELENKQNEKKVILHKLIIKYIFKNY